MAKTRTLPETPLCPAPVVLTGDDLTLEAVAAVARHGAAVSVSADALRRVARCRAVVEKLLDARAVVYGLTTGFGSLRDVLIDPAHVRQLQRNLIRSHSCGVGPPASEEVVRAMMVLRANTLARGFSGVRPLIVTTLVEMLNRRVYPVVPVQGSVGASGDLAPLSHLALVLMGEGEAFVQGGRCSGGEALRAAGLDPVQLEAKEGLALNNGTQFMTAVGALALVDAELLTRAGILACGLSLEAVQGVPRAFDARIHEARPHPGQVEVARQLREQLAGSEILGMPVNTARLHNALTYLKEAETILGREDRERCRTAAEGIRNVGNEVTELMTRLGGELRNLPDDEARRAAAAEAVARPVLSTQGIYEQVLSGSLPRRAAEARPYLKRALDELQAAVPAFVPVQDDYSFRCTPQVLGPVLDTLASVRATLTRELNAATDNPLIFPPDGPEDDAAYAQTLDLAACRRAVVSGGNFHGQPVAMALDQACLALASVANISERRTFHLVTRYLSNGLPPFLIRDVGLQSGLMLAQYTAAALVSENKTYSHPASVDSIPTCEGAEDHVSMGPFAARKFAEVAANTARVLAIELLCAAQGVDLRRPARPSPVNQELLRRVRAACPELTEDRPLGPDIERVTRALLTGALTGPDTGIR